MDVLDFLLDPWRSGIGRRALVEVLLLGGFCGALGFWVISFRLSYGAESLAHGLLPGLVIAALAGAPLLLGAGGGVLVAAALVAVAGRDERIGSDTAVAVTVTGLLGLGALLALEPEAPPRLEELLFGDPLAASGGDLLAAAALALAGGAALFALHRPLTTVAFDPGAAGPLGISATAVRLALLALLAIALAVAVQGLGNLLVLAAVVAPALAVQGHVTRPGRAIVSAAALASVAGAAGIYASFYLDAAAGASVALALCAAAGASTLLPRQHRYFRNTTS
jgi:ABC-type Mn2+/Zn2+ transport system permease subunit